VHWRLTRSATGWHRKVVVTMAKGKPSKGTRKDKRLKANKRKGK
jgi:hypothetical protein